MEKTLRCCDTMGDWSTVTTSIIFDRFADGAPESSSLIGEIDLSQFLIFVRIK